MSIFLSEIEQAIKNSLTHRQNLANTRTQTGWFMDKQPWVRLTSMAGLVSDDGKTTDIETRKKWILFGGVYGYKGDKNLSKSYASGFHEMYNMDSYYYNNDKLLTFDPNAIINNPIPGITNVDIQNKGTMGSVREATIKFVCWDINQLNVLENLYMTPGVSLLLEWGWNKDVKGRHITTNLSGLPPMHDYCLIKKATKEINNSGGHYGAIQGRIVNFGWSYKTNGGFDCHVTITSMAEAFLSADIHSKSQSLPSIGTNKQDDETSSDKRIEENIMYQILNTLEELEKYPILKNPVTGKISAIKMNSLTGKKKDDESEWWNEEHVTESDGGQYFVTFESLLTTINNTLSFIQDGKSSMLKEDTDCSADLIKNANGDIIGPTFDIKNIEINYKPQLISADPWVCMLSTPVFYAANSTKVREVTYNSINPNTSNISVSTNMLTTEGFDYFSMYPELKNFSRRVNVPSKIDLNTFLINLKFVYDCYKSTKTVNDFVLKILNGVSEVCGGLWRFELMIDHDRDSSKILIVDTQTTSTNHPLPFVFELGKINSVVINATIETEIDNDIKLQAMYGSTSSNPQKNKSTQSGISSKSDFVGYNLFGKNIINLAEGKIRPIKLSDKINQQLETNNIIPEGLKQRIYEAVSSGINGVIDQRKLTFEDRNFLRDLEKNHPNDYNLLLQSITPTGLNTATGNVGNASMHTTTIPPEIEITEDMIFNDYIGSMADVYKQRTPTTARLAIAATNKFVNEVIWKLDSTNKIQMQPQYAFPLIPLKLSLTIDGICGLKNGNCIDITYKPLRYIDRTYFQITNVTHSLSGASWITTIETIMRIDMTKVINSKIEERKDISQLTAPATAPAPTSKLFVSVTTVPGRVGEFGNTWNINNDKAIAGLHPSVRKNVTDIVNELDQIYNIKILINEGFRTSQKQKQLFGRWKTETDLLKAGFDEYDAKTYADPTHKLPKATTALPGRSPHEFGFAFDAHPSPKTKANYITLSQVAKKYGFELEKTPTPDMWHYQKVPAIGMNGLRKKVSTGQLDESSFVKL